MKFRKVSLAVLAMALVVTTASADIQNGKSVKISISNVPDADKTTINNTYPVSEGGTINMPFIGLVRAAGLSPQALAMSLQAQYKSAGIYNNPTIQVINTAEGEGVNQEIVTVGGSVNRTGPVPYRNELTLYQAVQAAGGPTAYGSMRRVTVFRDGKSRVYDLNKAEDKRIKVQRNDTIEVPPKDILGR